MAAQGNSPGLLCVKEGHRLIDGMRRVSEVEDSQAEARQRGLIPVVLFVENPKDLARVNDNTESAGLRHIANGIIVNDSTVEELRYKTAHALGLAIKKVINT
jgi:3'-phosphoadenosine 5'-phosphosulfate sulfotransferase